ncbi:MAG: aconitase family protein [Thermomicrobiales bacterium]
MSIPAGTDPTGTRAILTTPSGATYAYYRLATLAERGVNLDRLPITIRILLENVLRYADAEFADASHIDKLANWDPKQPEDLELPFMPGRVVLQDFTGVPAVVDLAAMRAAVARLGGDVTRINPLVPADLVIDHSVQVDRFGTLRSFGRNVELEYQRNAERYQLLRWAQQSFQNFRVVPPGTGIVHQVNLEYLSPVAIRADGAETVAFLIRSSVPILHHDDQRTRCVLRDGASAASKQRRFCLTAALPADAGSDRRAPDRTTCAGRDRHRFVLYITEMLRKYGAWSVASSNSSASG